MVEVSALFQAKGLGEVLTLMPMDFSTCKPKRSSNSGLCGSIVGNLVRMYPVAEFRAVSPEDLKEQMGRKPCTWKFVAKL